MRWPNVSENPGPPAEGRYCLAVCYCRQCDHYQPLPEPKAIRAAAAQIPRPPRTATRWDEREDPTWIDRL